MRILHVTTEFPPVIFGGLGTAVGGLVNASAAAGMNVAVLLVGGVLDVGEHGYGQPRLPRSGQEGPPEGVTGPGGVTFFQVHPFESVEAAVHVAKVWRADVLHLHTAWVWPHAVAILEQTGIPLVYTVHSVDRAEYDIGHELGHILEHCVEQEVAIERAARMIALTKDESNLLRRYYPTSRGRIRIIGNGIDDSAVALESAAHRKPTDSPLVLYTGRLVERKGIRDLVAAIPYVLERAPHARFVFAGGPPPLSGEEVARQWLSNACLPYRDRIHFTGWLSAVALEQWYCAADVQVVPSRYEPFGMVVLEGMLYGLPIVASAVGGPREILKHGKTGLLYASTDVGALGQAIVTLVTDPSLRRSIGAAAAAEVRRKWLWRATVCRMSSVYAEALSSQSRSHRGSIKAHMASNRSTTSSATATMRLRPRSG